MIRTALAFIVLVQVWTALAAPAAEPAFVDVFVPQRDGWQSIRIPSIVTTPSGVVLAFAEARKGYSDQSHNKIVLKRSRDGGRTWGPLQLVADDGANSLNNPCALVDRPSGRVLLMFQRVPAHLAERSANIAAGYDGPDVYRNELVWSDDDGASWTKPLDVTRSTKRPTGATTICSGPGVGIQLTRGRRAGRLIVPFNEGPFGRWNNYAVFSDDHGKTWACGRNVPGVMPDGRHSQVNEAQMVELADGSVLLNSRQFAGRPVRKTAVSRDGGETWSPMQDAPELNDPSCMGAVFRYSFPDGGGKSRILYSGPDSSTKRANGVVHLSYDEGKSWPVQRTLVPARFAYSILTRLLDGEIGCLFETGQKIVFARFTLEWLPAGKDQPTPP